MEDFADVTNGSEVWLGVAFRISEHILFVAQVRTEAVLEYMRRPRMSVHSVRATKQYSSGDKCVYTKILVLNESLD